MTRRVTLLVVLLAALPARAFDYLEHSYFSDRACREAQARLAPLLAERPALAPRYLALSLFCPERWERPYCKGGYKQLEGSLNRLPSPPADSGDHPITLGDFAALPDHLGDYGPVRGLPRAERDGLTSRLFEWLAQPPGDAGGVEADVAEDACESDEEVAWPRVEEDVRAVLDEAGPHPLPAVPDAALSPLRREPLTLGPHDPSGAYSFDNPRYLDLVLLNHNHFGEAAYGTWLGYHSAAHDLAKGRCEDLLALDDDALEDLADDLGDPAFTKVDWDALEGKELRIQGCRLVSALVRRRVLEWSQRAAPELVQPADAAIAQVRAQDAEFLARTSAAVMALVFEGGGLHFLQDGFAGGHLRTNRAARGLEDSRYSHDTDNRHGVEAVVGTALGDSAFVAFGDGFLLSRAPGGELRCDWNHLDLADDTQLTGCLVRRQRGLLVGASAASLLDWALDGAEADPLRAFLPTVAPRAGGLRVGSPSPQALERGTLPVPPPPFSYQSVLVSTSFDAAGRRQQLGMRTLFLSQLGPGAQWMTSYHFGLLTTLGGSKPAQVLTEFAYMFHWRWAARFLVNAGPFWFGGLDGLGQSVAPFTGVGPSAGVTFLPEGWTKIPLDVTLTYRMPLTLLDGRTGFSRESIRIEAHWLEIGIGLAFM